jgi:hypothetical protein
MHRQDTCSCNAADAVSGRRKFLLQASAGVAAFAGVARPGAELSVATSQWDLSWSSRLKGTHRAVFDVAEIESGFGAQRAALWAAQSMDVLGAAIDDVSLVIVLRAHAVVLAFQQSFWERHGIGRLRQVNHPVTLKATSRNPLLMDETDGMSPALMDGMLSRQIARGVSVLACNAALQAWVDVIQTRERVSISDAQERAVAALIPGVILQPSGVLAGVIAQQHGCAYIRAS